MSILLFSIVGSKEGTVIFYQNIFDNFVQKSIKVVNLVVAPSFPALPEVNQLVSSLAG